MPPKKGHLTLAQLFDLNSPVVNRDTSASDRPITNASQTQNTQTGEILIKNGLEKINLGKIQFKKDWKDQVDAREESNSTDTNLQPRSNSNASIPNNTITRTIKLIYNPTRIVFQSPFASRFMNTKLFPDSTSENPISGNPTGGDPPTPKKIRTNAEWDAIAAQKLGEGKTMKDVVALQQRLGITDDGKWGKDTQAAFDDWYIKSLGNTVPMRGNVIDYEKLHADPEYQKSFNSFKSQYVDTGWGGGKNRFVRVEDYQSIPEQFDENGQLTQEYKDYRVNERAKAYMISRKQGGKMNRIKYFQQGGQMQQQDVQQQIIQLVQAAMQGDQKATEAINKVMEAAKAGDQQAVQLAQMIQQVVEQMQGQATMAKWGSKLRYIRSLKYAKGGKTCPSCQNGGVPTNTPSKKINKKVEEKACGGKAKKKYFGGYIN